MLAQRLGIPGNTVTDVNWSYSTNNWSYFGHYSTLLVEHVNSFSAPADPTNMLLVVWVNNADFVGYINSLGPGTPGDLNLSVWTNAINASLSNHFQVVTNLYAKGARTLVMPNAVDITKAPLYAGITSTAEKEFIRQMVMYFNANFPVILNQARAFAPGLKIYTPDFFALLDDMSAQPTNYGLIKPDKYVLGGDPALTDYSLTGAGTNYLWWDFQDPTAKAHEIMADLTQHLLSPASITQLTVLEGSNRLDVAGLPIGLSGIVESRTSLVEGSWGSATTFNSTAAVQSIYVPATAPGSFYRLRFPFAWSWP